MAKKDSELNIGTNISRLRKKQGLTQRKLADMLCVSNKTVSKWERGAGYPEITQLIALSKLLGVSIDDLLMGERYGIAVAGNLLNDIVKIIDFYPKTSMLANILLRIKTVPRRF